MLPLFIQYGKSVVGNTFWENSVSQIIILGAFHEFGVTIFVLFLKRMSYISTALRIIIL